MLAETSLMAEKDRKGMDCPRCEGESTTMFSLYWVSNLLAILSLIPTGVPQARPISYNVIGSEYTRDYELSVLEILNRPNSMAFFFEGGLLA